MSTTVEQALADTIADLKTKLEKQKKRLEEVAERAYKLNELLNNDDLGWSTLSLDDDDGGLPVPRLELRWKTNEHSATCWYLLVHLHLRGHVQINPLGMTKCRGYGGNLTAHGDTRDIPFRDGAHAQHDSVSLGLPLFVTTPDGYAGRIENGTQTIVREAKS